MASFGPAKKGNSDRSLPQIPLPQTRRLGHGCLARDGDLTGPTDGCVPLPIRLQSLGELASGPDLRSLPIEDVDGDCHQDGQAAKNGARPLEMESATDIGVHRCCIHGLESSEQISRKPIASRRRRRVFSISGNHVVDGSHVDAVISNSDQEHKY